MNSILVAVLLASTALSSPPRLHPVPDTTNTTIHTRQVPTGMGSDSGVLISTFTNADCKGDGVSNVDMIYDIEVAQQLRSYSLSAEVGSDDILSVWADMDWDPTGSKPVDPSLNGNTNAACAQFVYDLEDADTTKGCHTLPNVVGCMIMSVAQN